MRWFADYASQSRGMSPVLLGLPLCVAPLGLVSCLTSGRAKPSRSPPRLTSSILVQLRRSNREARVPWQRPAERRIGQAIDTPAEAAPAAAASGANCPADILAKYGFVSGLLERRSDVAAYGCVDGFGSKMVLDKVKKLSVYDPDPSRIGEISLNIFDPLKFDAHVHDILDQPLPTVHDAIYNLDALEYISPGDEDRYLRNLSRSLFRQQDILIIGLAPCDADDDTGANGAHPVFQPDLGLTATDHRSFGSLQTGCPEKLSVPLRYRRTSAGVKALLESHFRIVSLFSMTGGVVQAGASGGSEYLFALCSSKKSKLGAG